MRLVVALFLQRLVLVQLSECLHQVALDLGQLVREVFADLLLLFQFLVEFLHFNVKTVDLSIFLRLGLP